LIFIGVVLGLLVFGKSLDFFAMLGLLGLIGMNIKNAIVLVDEIGLQLNAGLSPVNAVIEATKTRIVPVTMASGTTILCCRCWVTLCSPVWRLPSWVVCSYLRS
jgi:multidrug efflux pump subunit AcrB